MSLGVGDTPVVDSPDLADLYRSWGILDLVRESVEAMPPAWLQILNIARNLLDGRALPGVPLPAELTALLARDGDVRYERRTVRRQARPSGPPRPEDPEVRPIDSFAEFPRIILGQRMWQFIDPDLFFYRIYAHDVLIRAPDETPITVDDEEDIEEVVTVTKVRRRPRQKVLVLRDTSSSMRDRNKGIFAKAVALAYLIKAHEEGAEVADRSFANTVHPRLRAASAEEFAAIARRILREGYYGTTNLAAALEATMAEIRREELGLNPYARAKTEILLISDCENPEKLPPLPPGVTINTLHLEGGREGLMLRDYQERLREIQEISNLFVKIDTSALELPDAAHEAWALLEELRALRDDEADGRNDGAAQDRQERVRQAAQLLKVYDRMAKGAKAYRSWSLQLRRELPGARAGLIELLMALAERLRALLERLATRLGHGRHDGAGARVVFRPREG